MKLEVRILLPSDRDTILAWAREWLDDRQGGDLMEREMLSWTARWRAESLDHYLPQGWSFGCFENGRMRGFILGQPMLFFRGHTQSIWVEEWLFDSDDVGEILLDTVFRWARDKHIQMVFAENHSERQALLKHWPHVQLVDDNLIQLKSTRG